MHLPAGSGPLPLTSSSTTWFGKIVPGVATACAWGAAIVTWLNPTDQGTTLTLKLAAVGVAAVVSFGVFRWFGGFQHVWLDGDHLVVGDARSGFRIRLQDIEELKETRLQKLKWVKLRVARPTPLGQTIRFIPRGHRAWLAPWTTSPLVEDLRARIVAARGEDGQRSIER